MLSWDEAGRPWLDWTGGRAEVVVTGLTVVGAVSLIRDDHYIDGFAVLGLEIDLILPIFRVGNADVERTLGGES